MSPAVASNGSTWHLSTRIFSVLRALEYLVRASCRSICFKELVMTLFRTIYLIVMQMRTHAKTQVLWTPQDPSLEVIFQLHKLVVSRPPVLSISTSPRWESQSMYIMA